MKTIVFIGGGNVTTKMVDGLLASGYPPEKIIISNPSTTLQLKRLAEHRVVIMSDNLKAAQQAEVLVLAVKAQVISKVAQELSPIVEKNKPLVISVVSGTTLENLQTLLGEKTKIARAMPNIAAAIKKSATTTCLNKNISIAEEQWIEKFFGRMGTVKTRPFEEEALLSKDTAFKGCGTAYALLSMQAIVESAVRMGFDPQEALDDTLQLFEGAVALARRENSPTLSEMRRQVTTPNGVTASATDLMIGKGRIFDVYKEGLEAADKRSLELTKKVSEEIRLGSSHLPKFSASLSDNFPLKVREPKPLLSQPIASQTSTTSTTTSFRRGFFSTPSVLPPKSPLERGIRTILKSVKGMG